MAAKQWRAGLEAEVEAELERARAGGSPAAINAAGVRWARLGRAEAANAVFREVLAIQPHLPARNNLGASLIVLGRPGEALDTLAEALEDEPEVWAPRLNAILASLLSGRTDASLDRLMEPVPAPMLRQLWERAAALEASGVLRSGMSPPSGIEERLRAALSRRGVAPKAREGASTRARTSAGRRPDAVVYWWE